MRLDHLLSRENAEGEILLDPEVEGAGEAKAEAGAEAAREKDESPSRRRAGMAVQENLEITFLYRFEVPQYGGLAQLGERVLCKHEVIGSSPIFSTTMTAGSSAG